MIVWLFFAWVVYVPSGDWARFTEAGVSDRIEMFATAGECESERSITAAHTASTLKVVSECIQVTLVAFTEVEPDRPGMEWRQ